jgi:hypothetical protein
MIASYGWWAGDKTLSGQTSLYQYINFRNGVMNTTASSSPTNVTQLCLTAQREYAITLDSSMPWNETYASFMGKKGETLPLTVSVKMLPASHRPIPWWCWAFFIDHASQYGDIKQPGLHDLDARYA